MEHFFFFFFFFFFFHLTSALYFITRQVEIYQRNGWFLHITEILMEGMKNLSGKTLLKYDIVKIITTLSAHYSSSSFSFIHEHDCLGRFACKFIFSETESE